MVFVLRRVNEKKKKHTNERLMLLHGCMNGCVWALKGKIGEKFGCMHVCAFLKICLCVHICL